MACKAEAGQAKCNMFYVTAKAGSKNVPVSSDHSLTIRNTTGATQVYHVAYSNGIMFTAPWYSPIANKEFDVVVANGEVKGLPNERLMQTSNFYTKGTYASQALVVVKLGSKVVDYCEAKNSVYIF
jgi:hypothetical protein